MSRRPIIISAKFLKQLEKLASIQCTDGEICAVLGVSTTWLKAAEQKDERIVDAIKKGRDSGRHSLRRKQWEAAMAGSIPMMIWLGKQYLGQADKQQVEGNIAFDERVSKWLTDSKEHSAHAPTLQ